MGTLDSFIPLIEVWRGPLLESIHAGCAAVVDSNGRLLASAGNPDHVTFLRSSSKPMQALPLIEAGGAEAFNLSDEEIAIMCASHNGSASHVAVIAALQERLGLGETDLRCGTHKPSDPLEALRLARAGELPNQRHHNCSGKHTGMLAYAKLRGMPFTDYIDPQHPLQQDILRTVAEMCGITPADVIIGIDGCSVPVFGISMRQAAYGYARLADPGSLPPQRARACRRITSAMINRPDMVGGDARFDTRLMEAAAGKLFCKIGAEGYFAIGVVPAVLAPDSPGIGITMKFADGAQGMAGSGRPSYNPPADGDLDNRGLPVAVMAVLRQLGILSADELARLKRFDEHMTYNWRRLQVGEIRANFTLTMHTA